MKSWFLILVCAIFLAGCASTPVMNAAAVAVTQERTDVADCQLQGHLEPTISASNDPRYDPIRDMQSRAWNVHRADTLLVTQRHGKLWGESYRCSTAATPTAKRF